MSEPQIEFYFDFSSPYGYLAAHKVDALAAKYGRRADWRPILLGAVFRTTGGQPLPQVPLKGAYALLDFARSARFHGLPYRQPSTFPISGLVPTRAYWWLRETQPDRAVAFARAALTAYFAADRDVSGTETVLELARELGLDAAALAAALADPAVKERTRAEVEAAIAKGVFGSPYFIVDGEPFWGLDRMDQLERWLAEGGF